MLVRLPHSPAGGSWASALIAERERDLSGRRGPDAGARITWGPVTAYSETTSPRKSFPGGQSDCGVQLI
ncbi:hypothetical protein B296_00033161 [Ensete ventricosum]|uniref:Uncharacterized protein n=1 Tax=Ensete ventricosum TaxID=4639 RepID=A0A427AAC4_ENSVE|nr:hypothetical protein B296_00033161 [Ensete ventricosum]